MPLLSTCSVDLDCDGSISTVELFARLNNDAGLWKQVFAWSRGQWSDRSWPAWDTGDLAENGFSKYSTDDVRQMLVVAHLAEDWSEAREKFRSLATTGRISHECLSGLLGM